MFKSRNSTNYYWNGGAFCVNCGVLKGNVTNNGIHPIWHQNCKIGCTSSWNDQDIDDTDFFEEARLLDEEERYNLAYGDEDDEEYNRHCEQEYKKLEEEWVQNEPENHDVDEEYYDEEYYYEEREQQLYEEQAREDFMIENN